MKPVHGSNEPSPQCLPKIINQYVTAIQTSTKTYNTYRKFTYRKGPDWYHATPPTIINLALYFATGLSTKISRTVFWFSISQQTNRNYYTAL